MGVWAWGAMTSSKSGRQVIWVKCFLGSGHKMNTTVSS